MTDTKPQSKYGDGGGEIGGFRKIPEGRSVMTNLSDITHRQLQALKENETTSDKSLIYLDFATAENKQLVGHLEEILDDVRKSGQYIFPWHFMKPLYAYKLDKVTNNFLTLTPPLKPDGTEDTEEVERLKSFRTELLQMFDKFISAPFTIQRLTELLTDPKRHYKTTAKFFRGLEKNILVVTTVDHVPAEQRQILKRSHVESIPLSNQNGFVENELKPPVKKPVVERLQVVSSNKIETDSSVIQHNVLNISNNLNTNTKEDDKPNTSFENMLMCTEEVTERLVDSTDQTTPAVNDNKKVSDKTTDELTTPEVEHAAHTIHSHLNATGEEEINVKAGNKAVSDNKGDVHTKSDGDTAKSDKSDGDTAKSDEDTAKPDGNSTKSDGDTVAGQNTTTEPMDQD